MKANAAIMIPLLALPLLLTGMAPLDERLLAAAEKGDVNEAAALLKQGAQVNAIDGTGMTPLHLATGEGHEAVVRLLLERGASVNVAADGGWTPLHRAAQENREAVARLLLEKGAAVNAATNDGRTPIHLAAAGGHEAVARLLLAKDASVTVADNDNGKTPLHEAAGKGHEPVVRLLLANGAAVSVGDKGGMTPLHEAAGGGHEAVARLLLDKSAAVNATTKFGWTSLHQAADDNREAVVRLLLEKGAAVTVATKFGWTPLHLAARRGHEAVVRLLLDKGAPVNAAATDGTTPLNQAADKGQEAVVRLLLGKGARADMKDTSGKTPLDVAHGKGEVGTVTGTVTYTGKAEEKEIFFRKFPNAKFCQKIGTDGHKPDLVKGDKRILKTIEVGKGGALNAAVVAITDIEDDVWMDGYKGTAVVTRFCEFLPYTGVVVNQQNFHVENRDQDPDDPKSMKGVLHNAHSYEVRGRSSRTIFNFGLAQKGSTLDKKVILRKENQGSFLRLQCDQHEWEQAYFLPVKNPHYWVTGADGTFAIENVPAGTHKLIAWHPFAGQVEADIDVKDGEAVTANFQIKR